eukprot:Rmarinus@m.20054
MGKNSFLTFLTLAASAVAAPVIHEAKSGFGSTGKVMIIGLDGFGSMYLSPELNPEFPDDMHLEALERLQKEGSFTWFARSAMPTKSKPNWSGIITGAGPEETGVLDNSWTVGSGMEPITGPGTYFPSIFQLAHDAGLRTATYTDWSGFLDLYPDEVMDIEKTFLFGTKPMARDFCSEIIDTDAADLIFIHFDETDGMGHAFGFGSDAYLKGADRVDEAVQMILDCLEDNGALEDTTLILTADHGGTGRDHGSMTQSEAYTPLMVRGPHVRAGFEIPCPMEGMSCHVEGERGYYTRNLDTAVIAAYALGLDVPALWIGSPHEEIFCDNC